MRSADKAVPARRTRLTADQRRESILKAATEVFAEVGYRAGKVSDVAARVGVTEPVIFQNFGSKAALFAAVLDRVASDLHAELHSRPGLDDSAASLLAHILSPSRAGKPHALGSHRMLFADTASLIADPGAGEAASRAATVIAGHLADLVRRAQAEGNIRDDADPDAAAWLLLSVLSTRSLRAASMPRPGRLEPGVAALALRAIAAPAVAAGQEG
ncbi:MAG: TetR/AcrR family transcriptional regulator [Streptosporangiaceae bacterium]